MAHKAVHSLPSPPHYFSYLILEFFPLPSVHSVRAPKTDNYISSSLFLGHVRHFPASGPLHLVFCLECSSPRYLLHLGLCSNVTLSEEALPDHPI